MFDSLKPKTPEEEYRPSVDLVLRTVAGALDMTPEQLRKRPRRDRGHFQRWVVWAIARQLTTASFTQLARAFGYDHHKSIMYGISRLEAMLAADPEKAKDYVNLLQFCREKLKVAA